MTESVKMLTFIDIVFVTMLMMSGSFAGLASEIVYYLAFLIPIILGFYSAKEQRCKREEEKGVAEPDDKLLHFSLSDFKRLLPLIAPIILAIFLVSLLSSFLFSLIGVSANPVEEQGIIKMLVLHALIPAFLEEALFRYVPMKLLTPYSKRWCIIYSSLFFALIHCSFVSIPYAFVAGMIFMTVDMMLGSIWPSVILHFLNNAISVVSMKYFEGRSSVILLTAVLLSLSAVSMIFVLRKRGDYRDGLSPLLDKGECTSATYAPLALVVVCCYLAIGAI